MTGPLRLWRIAGTSYPVWSGEGARLKGARWNPPGLPAIYAGLSYAIAALEILVHANIGQIPRRFNYVEALVPDGAQVDSAEIAELALQDPENRRLTQDYGGKWLRRKAGLVLPVPSIVTRGLDQNAVVNPLHPSFAQVTVSAERPVEWDPRPRP